MTFLRVKDGVSYTGLSVETTFTRFFCAGTDTSALASGLRDCGPLTILGVRFDVTCARCADRGGVALTGSFTLSGYTVLLLPREYGPFIRCRRDVGLVTDSLLICRRSGVFLGVRFEVYFIRERGVFRL